jgi:glycosyltransferase involved in cell wall biosynthesis
MSDPYLSVVVPTYRGRDTLAQLIDRVSAVLDERGVSFELIIVNDASPDDTWTVLEQLARRTPNVHAIDLQINHGQPRATMCGLAHARGCFVATMDDDLQQPPEELPKLLDALEEHPDWDAVVGAWERDEGKLRDVASWVHAATDRLAYGTPSGWRHTSFRLMRRSVVDAMVANETHTPVVGPLLRQVTNRVHNVWVEHHPRRHGVSGFRIAHGIARVRANFLSASTLPLRVLSGFGFVCASLASIAAMYFLIRWAFGAQTPVGFLSTFLAVVFFGGATLLGLGIVGEYIALIVGEVRRPPRWIIRQEIEPSGHAPD